MSRIGINPARGKYSTYKPARVTVTGITYIPDLTGYFEHRLEVLKLCLDSLNAHTSLPHDTLIFDNGSCPAVTDYLRGLLESGQIDYLILSRQNIGKIGALKILFDAAPGEIVAYHDDDIFFYPGWLEAQLKILENFPNPGMVSGLPVRNAARHAHKSLDQIAAQPLTGITIELGKHIPNAWEADWAVSTGRDPQEHLASTANHQDMLLRINPRNEGVSPIEAIGSANHFEFIAYRRAILQALPDEWSGKLMGYMVELDEAVDHLGLLRLSTTQRYTRHLGNTLSPAIVQEAQQLGVNIAVPSAHSAVPSAAQRTAHARHWMLHLPGCRRILTALYNKIFRILYQ